MADGRKSTPEQGSSGVLFRRFREKTGQNRQNKKKIKKVKKVLDTKRKK